MLPKKEYQVKVRLKGIDCPEVGYLPKCEQDYARGGLSCKEQIPLGMKAKAYLSTLTLGKTITLTDESKYARLMRDSYKRIVANAYLENKENIGLHMLQEGYCHSK